MLLLLGGASHFFTKKGRLLFLSDYLFLQPLSFFFLTYIHTKAAKLLGFTSLLPCYSSTQKSIEYEKTVNCSPRSFMNPFLSSLSSFLSSLKPSLSPFLSSLKPSFSLLLLAPSSFIYYFSNLSLGFSSGPLPFSHFSPAPPAGIYSIPSGVLESKIFTDKGEPFFTLRTPNQVILIDKPHFIKDSHFSYLGSGTILSDGQSFKLLSWSTHSNSSPLYPSRNPSNPHNPILFKSPPLPFQSPPPPSHFPFKLNPNRGFFKFIFVSPGKTSSSNYLLPGSLTSHSSLSISQPPILSYTPFSSNSIFTNVSLSSDHSILSSTSYSPSNGFICSSHISYRFGTFFIGSRPLVLPSFSLSFSGSFIPIKCSD